MPPPFHCILGPPMTTGANDVWVFRIVHQDTGKPAPGVPVTVLDRAGNAEGHWVSDSDGTVAIPRRETLKLRIRVGLRSEDPIELATATLGEGPTPLAAPTQLPPTIGSIGHVGERPGRDAPPAQPPPPRGAEQPEAPGHVLYFQRLVMFGERAAATRPATGAGAGPRDGAVDFFSPATDSPSAMRYGVLIELEEYWQSLGVLWGELLYSVTLTPGDEAKLAVLDGRWRREADGRERPLQILARMVGTSMLGDLITALRPELQLDPLTVAEPGLEAVAADTVQMIRDRTERMSHALRRRPLGVVDAPADTPATGAIRHVRNTTRDRLVTFHFFEPLERFKVMVRSPRARPVVFVPFRLPNVATADVIQRFGYLFRRTLLDRGLLPDLERLLSGEEPGAAPSGAPRSRLLEHIEANLLYYSTAIISAGDPAARYVALSKLRHRAAPALGGRAAGPVAGRARRLPGAPAAGERRLRGHDSASRRLGERPGPRADAAGAGRLARGGRVSRLLRRSLLYTSVAAALAACLFQAAPVTPQVAKDSAAAGPAAPRSAPVHDSVLEQRVARLELLVAERDAQVEDLEARLDEARQEVVRALAKLQTVASHAEAASAIAEAEIAVQALRAATGTQPAAGADVAQAGTLLQQASAEFASRTTAARCTS